jgi:hypothetical protein
MLTARSLEIQIGSRQALIAPSGVSARFGSLPPGQVDSRFGYPSALAFRAFRRLPQLLQAEFETALFADSGFNHWFVLGVFQRLQKVFEVRDGVFAGLLDESRDFGDGHRMIDQHRYKILPEHNSISRPPRRPSGLLAE